MTDEKIEEYVFSILLLMMVFFIHGDMLKEIGSAAVNYVRERQEIHEECRTEFDILDKITHINGVIEAKVSYEDYLGCSLHFKINGDVISYVHYAGTRLMRVNSYFNGRATFRTDSAATIHESMEIERTIHDQGDSELAISDYLRFDKEDHVADIMVHYIENVLLPNILVR